MSALSLPLLLLSALNTTDHASAVFFTMETQLSSESPALLKTVEHYREITSMLAHVPSSAVSLHLKETGSQIFIEVTADVPGWKEAQILVNSIVASNAFNENMKYYCYNINIPYATALPLSVHTNVKPDATTNTTLTFASMSPRRLAWPWWIPLCVALQVGFARGRACLTHD